MLVLSVPGPGGLVSRVARTRHQSVSFVGVTLIFNVGATVQRRARSDGEHDPAGRHEARVVDTRCSRACNAMRDALERVDTTRSSSFRGDTSAATFRPRRRLDGPDSQSLPNPIFVDSLFAVRLEVLRDAYLYVRSISPLPVPVLGTTQRYAACPRASAHRERAGCALDAGLTFAGRARVEISRVRARDVETRSVPRVRHGRELRGDMLVERRLWRE